MVKKTLWLCLLLFGTLTLFAQNGSLAGNPRSTETALNPSQPNEAQAALIIIIYNNLGAKSDAYSTINGWGVRGPNGGGPHFFAMAFTPKANSHVSQVQAAVQYGGKGANQVNLSIYGDSGGSPGTLLAGPVTVTNLSKVGTCCSLAVANFTPLAITGGSRYWIVADTFLTGTGSDFVGLWEWVPKPVYPQAANNGAGWMGYNSTNGEAAVKVLGTSP